MSGKEKHHRVRRSWRVLAWIGGGLALLAVLALGALWLRWRSLPLNADALLRDRLVASLTERFHSPVELDSLHLDTSHGLRVTGTGLRILYLAGPTKPDANPGAPPMLQVARFEFQTGLKELLKPTMRVVTVYVEGMELHIPPHPRLPSGVMPDSPRRRGQPGLGIAVDKIVLANSKVVLETSVPGKLPLVFQIANLTLIDVGQKQPFAYDASLTNPRPVGEVHSPATSALAEGQPPRHAARRHVHLSARRPGLNQRNRRNSFVYGRVPRNPGRCRGRGHDRYSELPARHQRSSGGAAHRLPGRGERTTGDTTLRRVDVRVLHSILHASGSVFRVGTPATGVTGHDTELTVDMGPQDHGRIEDMLLLGVKTSPPVLRGAMVTHQRLSIPPGKVSVSQKMRLEGSFTITGATFSNPGFQETIDKLSMRAQGRPQQANHAGRSGCYLHPERTIHPGRCRGRYLGAGDDAAGRDRGVDGALQPRRPAVRLPWNHSHPGDRLADDHRLEEQAAAALRRPAATRRRRIGASGHHQRHQVVAQVRHRYQAALSVAPIGLSGDGERRRDGCLASCVYSGDEFSGTGQQRRDDAKVLQTLQSSRVGGDDRRGGAGRHAARANAQGGAAGDRGPGGGGV